MLKYKVKESDILKILENDDALTLRDGAINFINYLNENNIPLIISSAGIGNFIIELLKKQCFYFSFLLTYASLKLTYFPFFNISLYYLHQFYLLLNHLPNF